MQINVGSLRLSAVPQNEVFIIALQEGSGGGTVFEFQLSRAEAEALSTAIDAYLIGAKRVHLPPPPYKNTAFNPTGR